MEIIIIIIIIKFPYNSIPKQVSGTEMSKWLNELCPIILDMLQDASLIAKREVRIRYYAYSEKALFATINPKLVTKGPLCF